MPTYTRSETIVFSAPPSVVLKLFQEQPIEYLRAIELEVQDDTQFIPGTQTGEWTGKCACKVLCVKGAQFIFPSALTYSHTINPHTYSLSDRKTLHPICL